MRRLRSVGWVVVALSLACDSGAGGPEGPGPADTGGTGVLPGGGDVGGGDGTPPPQGTGALAIELERQGRRGDVRHLDLTIAGVALFFGEAGPEQRERGACVVGNDFFDLRTQLRLDLRAPGRTRLGTIATANDGAVAEIRLFVRAATAARGDKDHPVHGRRTCTGPDGTLFAVVFVRPDEELRVVEGERVTAVIAFDARGDLVHERVTCSAVGLGGGDGGPGGAGGGPAGGGTAGGGGGPGGGVVGDATDDGGGGVVLAGQGGSPECQSPDDDDDDRDPRTRLRFFLPLALSYRPEP